MSINDISLGESELEIMKVIWKHSQPITSVDIGKEVEVYGWKKTTISTFLTRLTEKGAVSAEKHGKLYYYTPLITEEQYKQSQTKILIENLYHGSVKELAASLFDNEGLTGEDIAELREIIDGMED